MTTLLADGLAAEERFIWQAQLRGAVTSHIQQEPRIARTKARLGIRMWGADVELTTSWRGYEQFYAIDVKGQAQWRNGEAGLNYSVNEDSVFGLRQYMLAYQVPKDAAWFGLQPLDGSTPYVLGLDEIEAAPLVYGDKLYYSINVIAMRLRTLDFLLGPVNPMGLVRS